MTEVPEHLLQRSRERREALGLDTEGGSAAPAERAPAPAAAAAPAPVVEAEAVAELPVLEAEPVLARVPTRAKVPVWIMPVLVALPVYAFIYAGAFGNRSPVAANDPVAQGNTVFHSVGCAGCHGANGEGGVGPALANVHKTFPNLADQILWVHTGSAPFAGKTYANSGRVATGGMPAFGTDHGGSVSDADIAAVVCYERVTFGNGAAAQDCPTATTASAAAK